MVTKWKKAWSGNAFMSCGVLYVIKKYNELHTEICYVYDTNLDQEIKLNLPIMIPYQWLAYADYSPKDKLLYVWDNGNQLFYNLTVGGVDHDHEGYL